MPKQFCYDIKTTESDIDIYGLKNFVRNLYIGKGANKFDESNKIPFIVIYAKSDRNICIITTSQAKKNMSIIESVHKKLTPAKLRYGDIQLSTPYLFDTEAEDWWEAGAPNVKGERWQTLTQRGPYFASLMQPYESLGATITYDGKEYELDPEEERIASFYARRLISEEEGGVTDLWTQDATFNRNFWNDFRKYLTKEHKKIFRLFPKIGWDDLKNKILMLKEYELTDEEKREKKVELEERKREYGYAYIDGHREKVKNYNIEPAGILFGRGKKPTRGKIKRDILPEDVTINIGRGAPIPKPPPGHKWGNIVHDQKGVWLAKWKDTISGDIKYVFFSDEGKFKGQSDLLKYEKARKLDKHIDEVRNRYMVDTASDDLTKKQLGTVLFFIDNMGIRVGNEKGEDEAETFGATTLQVGHVKIEAPNKIIFDFLGKDSIRFFKEVQVPMVIYNNFKLFMRGKGIGEDLFDYVTSKSVNDYLKEFDKSFTAKVFRTRLASSIMSDALKEVKVPTSANKTRTKQLFNKANKKVAEVLNHTRNISKKAEETVKNYQDKLKEMQKDYKKLTGKKKETMKERIKKQKEKIAAKTDTMAVAMTTSINNYIDPRIVIAWSESQKADLSAIYTSALMSKFNWAVDSVDKNWDYVESPLIGNPDLEPMEKAESAVSKAKRESKKHRKSKSPKRKEKPNPGKRVTSPEDNISIKDVREWCRKKYGALWWKVSPQLKNTRKKEAYEAIKAGDSMPKKSISKNLLLGPGTLKDYQILLEICKDPQGNVDRIIYVSNEALKWVYQFSKYTMEDNFPDKDRQTGTTANANKFIVDFYEQVRSG